MTTLLIDADGVAFKAASAAQTSIQWDDDVFTSHGDLNTAKQIFMADIDKFRDVTDADATVILCYSCPTRRYFRHDLLASYKGNRKGTAAPLALKALKEWSAEKFLTKTKPHLEADDVLGILATDKRLVRGERIIVSIDKDMRQIPGRYLNAGSPTAGFERIIPTFAERFLWLQLLTGDVVDGYGGCPGTGPVKAETILDKGAPYWEHVLDAYEKAYKNTPMDPGQQFETMVNVARILTSSSYNFKTKEPILWQKPTLTS